MKKREKINALLAAAAEGLTVAEAAARLSLKRSEVSNYNRCFALGLKPPPAPSISARNAAIMEMIAAGQKQTEIAEHFGITAPRVWQIVQRETRRAASARAEAQGTEINGL